MDDPIVEFVRSKDYRFVRELGEGACGRTVLLHDDLIDEPLVCKKYAPHDDELRPQLYQNFVREIKLLHLVNHENVVRVFSHFLYPLQFAGYILMEYVSGLDLEEHLKLHPGQIDQLFVQAVNGFSYLEGHQILHRDIRPQNVLVSELGQLKIIDFGFGKRIVTLSDFDKSVSLNWWCDPPEEFGEHVYDFRTEVYFVGSLFSKILKSGGYDDFQYTELLSRMCRRDPAHRTSSFAQVRQEILAAGFQDLQFSEEELAAYRAFSTAFGAAIAKVHKGAKYVHDTGMILRRLEDLHNKTMLEEFLPSNNLLARCFLNGEFYYSRTPFSLATLKDFLELFRSCSRERRDIIVSNLHTRLDVLQRYDTEVDDDLPF